MSRIDCCHSEPSKNYCCSKPVREATGIIGLVITILAGLALIGMYYPASGLGVLTNAFTWQGTYALLATGVILLCISLIRFSCKVEHSKKVPSYNIPVDIYIPSPTSPSFPYARSRYSN